MWRFFLYCFTLVSFILVGGNFVLDIRDDYCDLYMNASEISDKFCHKNGSIFITNEYEMTLIRGSFLFLNWTNEKFVELNVVAITNKRQNLSSLEIFGNWEAEDPRLRPSSVYLNMLNVEHVKEFQIIGQNLMIYEKDILYKQGPIDQWIAFKKLDLDPINTYVAASTKRIRNLQLTGLNGPDYDFCKKKKISTLQEQIKLNLRNLNGHKITCFDRTKKMQHLNLTGLHSPDSDLCSHFKFFCSSELQENVEELTLNVDMTVKMICFKNYRRLKFIFIEWPYEPFENLTALICSSRRTCNFTIGINGLRCPVNCECFYNSGFNVYCRNKSLTQIPPLPIPSDYRTELFCVGLQLRQLPNNTLPGYNEVFNLDVSDNKLTSLAIHQLPRKLMFLDISYNLITTIDNGVANYFNEHPIIFVYQSNIRWIAKCAERNLLEFLQHVSYYESVFFDQLNGECPHKCKCCFDRNTDNFVIDCISQDVNLPKLPEHIPNKLTLLFNNCSIKELPKNLLRSPNTQNIEHLDIRNNYLEFLDDETVAFYNNHYNATIELSGNPWNCHCQPKSFLSFLKNRNSTEYSNALARCKIRMCPESCICCLDNLDSTALNVDCQGQGLTRFPFLPDSVTRLDLRNNNIMEIDLQSQQFLNNAILTKGLQIFLSGNPWTCTCEQNDFFAFARNTSRLYIKHSLYIEDYNEVECRNLGKLLVYVDESEICPSYFIYSVLLIVFSLMTIMALNAFVYFKQPILMWFYEHEICMSMAVRLEMELLKKFDAFLCFTHKDENLVEEYVESLENGQRKFRLCFYLRDWQVGASIPECIIQSVKDSRRIIILMTKNFLESTWGKLEFRLALHATSKDRCKRLIVILYPDVENFDDLDSELKAYMVLNTYLRRDSPNFWNKLIYSMPHDTFLKEV